MPALTPFVDIHGPNAQNQNFEPGCHVMCKWSLFPQVNKLSNWCHANKLSWKTVTHNHSFTYFDRLNWAGILVCWIFIVIQSQKWAVLHISPRVCLPMVFGTFSSSKKRLVCSVATPTAGNSGADTVERLINLQSKMTGLWIMYQLPAHKAEAKYFFWIWHCWPLHPKTLPSKTC